MRITSLLVYGLLFIAVYFVFFIAERTASSSKQKRLIFLGVLVLAVFAGIRNISVGYDTERTILFCFTPSTRVSSFSGLGLLIARKEIFYTYFSFLLSKISKNHFVFLFSLQFITAGAVAVSAYKERKNVSISLCMLIYMLMYYLSSFNIIRQNAAAAVLLLAFVEYRNKSFVKATIFAVLCCFLHNSGVVGLFIIIAIIAFTRSKNQVIKCTAVVLAGALIAIIIINWQTFANWLIGEGYISSSYAGYIDIFSGNATSYSSKYVTITNRTYVLGVFRIIEATILLLLGKSYSPENINFNSFAKYAIAISVVIYSWFVFGFNSYLGDRLTIFLDYFKIIYISMFVPAVYARKDKTNRLVLRIPKGMISVVVGYYFIYGFTLYIYYGYGGVLPFRL